MDIATMLSQYHNTKCADFRDRIYALLALVTKSEGFSVDYRESGPSLALRAYRHFHDFDQHQHGVEFAAQLTKALRITYLDCLQEHIQRQQCWPPELVSSLMSKIVLNIFIRVRFFLRSCRERPCRSSNGEFEIVTWRFASMPRTTSKTVHFESIHFDNPRSWPMMILKVEEDFCPPHHTPFHSVAAPLHLFWSAECKRLFDPSYRIDYDAYTARTLLDPALHAMVQTFFNEQQDLSDSLRQRLHGIQAQAMSHLEIEVTPFSVRDPARSRNGEQRTNCDTPSTWNEQAVKPHTNDTLDDVLPFAMFGPWLASVNVSPKPGPLFLAG